MRTHARPQSHARCCRTCSTRGDAMRSLPIANAFRRPPASSCKGSSTGCFDRLVTESDCRRPRNVGVRQELVRVSVRAVDMAPGRLRTRPAQRSQSVLRVAGGVTRLDFSTASGGCRIRHSSVLCLGQRRLASSRALPAPLEAPPASSRHGVATLLPASRRRALPRRRLLNSRDKTRHPPAPSSSALQPETLAAPPAATGARTTIHDPQQATVTTGAPLRRRGQPHGDRG